MTLTGMVKTAFSICILLSLVSAALLLSNARAITRYCHMIKTGKEIEKSVLQMELKEKDYLVSPEDKILDDVKDRIDALRKSVSTWEKSGFVTDSEGSFQFAMWEEAIDLYERLFDQFALYRKAVEKNIREIRNLENRILAVIYSKMNPERGIIALQEIRIHEKGYLLYRNTEPPAHERPFEDKRKEAVEHLLMWAQNDPRIEELIETDNRLFSQITSNYEGEDHTLLLIERERVKLGDMAERFMEEGTNGLDMVYRHCLLLSTALLSMWLLMAVAMATATITVRGR